MDIASFLIGYQAGKKSAGGSSDDFRYVTFMTYDGSEECGKKAVAKGDDCADPIERGIFPEPARASTVEHDFVRIGWATTPNGPLDENALKAVDENRVVYAAYAAVTRYYTVTYYDDDSTTVLRTQSMPYGAIPNYIPTKKGYTFDGWTTELVAVTGDASYTAKWIAKLDLNTLSWAEIAAYAESGEAAEVLEVGSEKTFTVNSVSVTVRIIGFNHDDLADGTGKAGITFIMKPSCGNQSPSGSASYFASEISSKSSTCWDGSNTRSFWNDTTTTGRMMTSTLPAELRNVIKQVRKKYYNITNAAIETTDDYLWLISICELGYNGQYNDGECYEFYTPNKVDASAYPELIMDNKGTDVNYITRSKFASGYNIQSVTAAGKKATITQGSSNGYTFACFCI